MDSKSMGKLFRKCISTFTTQFPDMIFADTDELFLLDNNFYILNREHPFFQDYPAACWTGQILIDVFLKNYPLYAQDSYNESSVVKCIRQDMRLQLAQELENQIHGLDMDVISALGGERYESKEGSGLSIVLLPFPVKPNSAIVPGLMLFNNSMQVSVAHENVHALRKLLNMTKDACLVVCAFKEQGKIEYRAVGLTSDQEVIQRFPCIRFVGHMEWAYCLPCSSDEKNCRLPGCRMRYRQGRLFLPELNISQPEKLQLNELLGMNCDDTVVNLVQEVKKIDGGAVLILGSERVIRSEQKRLCNEKLRGFAFEKPEPLWDGQAISTALLKRLTAIDGAVMVDLNCKAWACGVILDGETKVQGDLSRGARFNCTNSYVDFLRCHYKDEKAYVGAKVPVIGMVVSEDGMVNLL